MDGEEGKREGTRGVQGGVGSVIDDPSANAVSSMIHGFKENGNRNPSTSPSRHSRHEKGAAEAAAGGGRGGDDGADRIGGCMIDQKEKDQSPSPAPPSAVEEKEEEEPVCRVCHMEAEPDEGRPLYHPCLCRGSIKYVHQDCLLQWLSASRNSQRSCELCGASFTFSPVYASGAPRQLSLWEIVQGLHQKALTLSPFISRGLFLSCLWLIILPYITCAIFQVYFVNSWSELQPSKWGKNFFPFAPKKLLASCLGGTILCTCILVISFVAINLRDLILHQVRVLRRRRRRRQRRRQQEQQQQQQQGGEDGGAADNGERGGGEEEDGGEEREGEAEPLLPIPPAAALDEGQGEGGNETDGEEEEQEHEEEEGEAVLLFADANAPAAEGQGQGEGRGLGGLLFPMGLWILDMNGAGEGDQQQHQQQQGDDAGGGLAGGALEGALDIRELIGLNAPLKVSLWRWAQFVLYNFLFLTLFQLFPYRLGRLLWVYLLHHLDDSSMSATSAANLLLAAATTTSKQGEKEGEDSFYALLERAVEAILAANRSASASTSNSTINSSSATNTTLITAAVDALTKRSKSSQENMTEPDYEALFIERIMNARKDGDFSPPHQFTASPYIASLVDKLAILGLGYSFLLSILGTLAIAYLTAHLIQNPRRALRIVRQIGRAFYWCMAWTKISLMVSIDLLLIPQALGWTMDFITVDIFGTTAWDRMNFFLEWPLVSLSAHWLCGFSFMALSGLLATELRRVLHPDVLRGLLPQPGGGGRFGGGNGDGGGGLDDALAGGPLMNGAEENIAELLGTRLMREHIRKMLLAFLIYLPLLLVVLYLPVRFGHTILLLPFPFFSSSPSSSAYHLPPLRLHFMPTSALYLEMQLPLELFLFHIAMPIMLERFRLKTLIRYGLEHGFASLCISLGLTSLLEEDALRTATRQRGGGGGGGIAQPLLLLPPRPEPPVVVPRLEPGGEEEGGTGRGAGDAVEEGAEIGAVANGEEARAAGSVIIPNAVQSILGEGGQAETAATIGGREGQANDEATPSASASVAIALAPGRSPSLEEVGRHEALQAGRVSTILAPPSSASTAPSLFLFPLRVLALIFLSALALFLTSSFAIHVPIRVGRLLLGQLGLPTDHDFYNIGVGFLSTWAMLYVIKLMGKSLFQAQIVPTLWTLLLGRGREGGGDRATRRTLMLCFNQMYHFLKIGLQCLCLLSLWLLLLPVLIGLLFEYVVIIPARVPLNETPFVPPYEAWALGLVFLKIWVRCELLGVMGADHTWKRKFDRVKTNGIRNLDFKWTLEEVVWPVLRTIAGLVLTPYFLMTTTEIILVSHQRWGMEMVAKVGRLKMEEVILGLAGLKRHAYLTYLLARFSWLGLQFLKDSFKRLHDKIRDDQYLVGLELKNR